MSTMDPRLWQAELDYRREQPGDRHHPWARVEGRTDRSVLAWRRRRAA